jgi:2-polyprenyl-6-methoxyphenol hydroxylase-like FAD-dependent oxidoreductase
VSEPEVLIVGAGPVGLILALDLGQRGIRVTVVERNDRNGLLPKMERCNARTMEILRRLGIAEEVRDAGFPRSCPMDVFIITTMAEPPILHLPYPSVAELKREIADCNDGSKPLEPYQLISQYTLEPLLVEIIRRDLPNVDIRFSHELISFEQDAETVRSLVRLPDGSEKTVTSRYLVGCDGGSSTVRKQLGIRYEGQGQLRRMRHALFRCDDLFDRIPVGRGRHYHVADDEFTMVTVQDSRRHFRMTTLWKPDEDMEAKFRRVVGIPIEPQVIYTGEWTQNLLCATSFGEGRVLIAGDAAHLVIPTGGLGMNTGVGDAYDLAWKLAGTLQGWGGPGLVASYLTERRQIGRRNVNASGAAMKGRLTWRSAYSPKVRERGPDGDTARAHIARVADVEQRKTNEILGIEMGYRYIDTTLIIPEPGEAPDPDCRHYRPTTWPGARLPHVWLENGQALHDRLGPGYTLLRIGADAPATAALEAAFHTAGAPLEVLAIDEAAVARVCERKLILVRPDLHVVWRGDAPPNDPWHVAATAVGLILPESAAA